MNNPFKSDRNIFGNLSKPTPSRVPQQNKQQKTSKISEYKPYQSNQEQKLTFGKPHQSQIQKDFAETRKLMKGYENTNPYDNRSSSGSQIQQYYPRNEYQSDIRYSNKESSIKQSDNRGSMKSYGETFQPKKIPSFANNNFNKIDDQFLNLDAISEDLSKLLAQSKTQEQFRKILGMNTQRQSFNHDIHQNYQLNQHKNQNRSNSPQPLQYHESKTVQTNHYKANKIPNMRQNNWMQENQQPYKPFIQKPNTQETYNYNPKFHQNYQEVQQEIQPKQTCYFNPHKQSTNIGYNFIQPSSYEQPQEYHMQKKQKSKGYPEQIHKNKFRDQQMNFNRQRQFQPSNTHSQSFRPFHKLQQHQNSQKFHDAQPRKNLEERSNQIYSQQTYPSQNQTYPPQSQIHSSQKFGENKNIRAHQDRYEIKQTPQVFEYANKQEDYGQSIQEILKRQMQKLCTKGKNRAFLTSSQKIDTVIYQFQPL